MAKKAIENIPDSEDRMFSHCSTNMYLPTMHQTLLLSLHEGTEAGRQAIVLEKGGEMKSNQKPNHRASD